MKLQLAIVFLIITGTASAQQKIISLYPGKAPGSENWSWAEKTSDSNAFKVKLVYDVAEPTLTVFPAKGIVNTGTAVIIAPGGGLFMLSINSEGNDVAEWLSKKGVTAFVLKYRLVHSTDPVKDFMEAIASPKKLDSLVTPIIPLAMNDGLAAVAYVRKNAASFNVDTNRIGFMGFSAGGGVAMSVAYNGKDESFPNFIVPVYAWDKNIVGNIVPKQKMPAFIVVAADDQIAPVSMAISSKWREAGQQVEAHIYQNGGHGFGMRKQGKPSDSWIDRFGDWLGENGLLWPAKPTGALTGVTYKMYKQYLTDQEENQRTDWQFRRKYAGSNAALSAPEPGQHRIVFMGNSITEAWKMSDSGFFSGRQYIDRGISGQTTPQMLLRFREDVINLKPDVVVILAGINDIAENTGPISLENIFGNIVSMVELAKVNKIRIVLSSVLPAYDFSWRPGMHPAEKVGQLNDMIQAYARKNNIVYVDYFTPMADSRKGLKSELTSDGVHPTLAGYKVMEPLVEKAIAEALKR